MLCVFHLSFVLLWHHYTYTQVNLFTFYSASFEWLFTVCLCFIFITMYLLFARVFDGLLLLLLTDLLGDLPRAFLTGWKRNRLATLALNNMAAHNCIEINEKIWNLQSDSRRIEDFMPGPMTHLPETRTYVPCYSSVLFSDRMFLIHQLCRQVCPFTLLYKNCEILLEL